MGTLRGMNYCLFVQIELWAIICLGSSSKPFKQFLFPINNSNLPTTLYMITHHPKSKNMRPVKVAFAVFSIIAIVRICTAMYNAKHVFVKDELPSGLVLGFHCLSADDDLGSKLLAPGEEWGFSFRVNIFGSTLFHCGFWWAGSPTYRFSVYNDKEHRYVCENCHWSIRINETCLYRSSIEMVGCYGWVGWWTSTHDCGDHSVSRDSLGIKFWIAEKFGIRALSMNKHLWTSDE